MAKIDLAKLGLTSESTFEEIQKTLNSLDVFTQEEVDAEKNSAAAGARKAALAQAKNEKNILSKDEMDEYKTFKKNQKLETLKENETLKKFKDEDFELIVKANGLTDLDGDELEEAISNIAKTESKRFKSDIPEVVTEDDEEDDNDDLDADDF